MTDNVSWTPATLPALLYQHLSLHAHGYLGRFQQAMPATLTTSVPGVDVEPRDGDDEDWIYSGRGMPGMSHHSWRSVTLLVLMVGLCLVAFQLHRSWIQLNVVMARGSCGGGMTLGSYGGEGLCAWEADCSKGGKQYGSSEGCIAYSELREALLEV